MRRDGRFALALLAFAWLAGVPPGGAQTPSPELSIELRGQPAQPGSILAITVTTTTDAESVTATAFGQTARLVRDGSARHWRGLIGVDLGTTLSSSLEVTADLGGGRHVRTPEPLALKPRLFATRRLSVASRFVDPAREELERIRLEAARLETIFAAVTVPARIETFVRPIPGAAGTNFGSRSIFNGEPRAPHAGADFRGAAGTPIAAPGGGRVVLAEDLFFTGQTVVIDHGVGLYSLLAHLSRIDVRPGQTVARGDVVGLLGATGRVTGPHLHWTVRLNGARVDPLRLVALLAPAQSGAVLSGGPKATVR
ncbi:MAG TPA: M23 family metallopeptidase [Vicinamibacterales bacterium]|jgi:murein DD-endopeptidase MepM/ murein hydrolase activator NlpD|nr:M23 family metallopeptidase [Vicinamibacterales bacterium]